ncbi:RNA-binding protein [Paenibacillus sp. S-38]|uniref:RNA-binding protein n=1 Tax=Paenibacillus sp. S-38 TaxID=3416710 RepID=UPI003CEB6237
MTAYSALQEDVTFPPAGSAGQAGTPPQEGADVLQLPDLLFVTYCFRTFGLNRGIYNTIDEWLYRSGILEITKRRQTVIAFLSEQQRQGRPPGTYLKFGKGALTGLLHDFVTNGVQPE